MYLLYCHYTYLGTSHSGHYYNSMYIIYKGGIVHIIIYIPIIKPHRMVMAVGKSQKRQCLSLNTRIYIYL